MHTYAYYIHKYIYTYIDSNHIHIHTLPKYMILTCMHMHIVYIHTYTLLLHAYTHTSIRTYTLLLHAYMHITYIHTHTHIPLINVCAFSHGQICHIRMISIIITTSAIDQWSSISCICAVCRVWDAFDECISRKAVAA